MLNKDMQQIIFDFLPIDDKYSFHKYSDKYYKDNIIFTRTVLIEINNMDKNKWCKLCYSLIHINHTFVDDHINNIKWKVLSHFKKLNKKFISKYNRYLDMKVILYNQFLNEKFI